MNKSQLHDLIDQLPENDLEIVARVLQGLRATVPLTPPPARFPAPVGSSPRKIDGMAYKSNGKLAQEYGRLIRDEPPESGNLLRKVMFTPLDELLSWVNQMPAQEK